MFEAGSDEQPVGKVDAQHLAGLAAGAPAEPDRQTNEPVAHQTQVKRGAGNPEPPACGMRGGSHPEQSTAAGAGRIYDCHYGATKTLPRKCRGRRTAKLRSMAVRVMRFSPQGPCT